MASGAVKSCRYVSADSPVEYSFTKSFAGSARTNTTALETGYTGPAGGEEYWMAFSGFDVNNGAIILCAFAPNVGGDGIAIANRNINSSASNDRPCRFNRTFIRSDMTVDDRNE